MDIKLIAEKLRDKLKRYNDFKGLYLYGSRVNGSYSENSDVDIVAVFDQKTNYDKELEISGHIVDIELENDVFIDFHPMTEEELNFNPVYFNEVKKGIYYAA